MEIRADIVRRRKLITVCRFIRAKDYKEKIASWISDLNRILTVFNVRSVTLTRQSLIPPRPNF